MKHSPLFWGSNGSGFQEFFCNHHCKFQISAGFPGIQTKLHVHKIAQMTRIVSSSNMPSIPCFSGVRDLLCRVRKPCAAVEGSLPKISLPPASAAQNRQARIRCDLSEVNRAKRKNALSERTTGSDYCTAKNQACR